MFPLYYTGIGPRSSNQDYYMSASCGAGILLAVADGVGGNNGGEIASKLAISTFYKSFCNLIEKNSIKEALELSMRSAHEALIRKGDTTSELKNMATTLTVAFIKNKQMYVVHAGDSRLYVIRGMGLKQLTMDDTEVNKLVSEGVLSKQEALVYPRKNILTNALGIKDGFTYQSKIFTVKPNDRVLILSDGFYQAITKKFFRDLALEEKEFSNYFFELVYKCQENGPKDNFTLVGVEIS
ncbi:protein phosphatase 2C domain-containing protein [Acinetobacter sp. NIPH 1869]|uniref:PP2C family protein-serine/threonine phosphatase n=1 Tax=Acinetobacter higginsii TaxID=70347 RepID=UPI001F4AA9DA|nr:PP2C family serine/threonine-protein phosphatase [Acinetobacter higginsii]MCH7303984.1 protein phosphatase 2C domain-containing protein [Acinetobacter higginsii]